MNLAVQLAQAIVPAELPADLKAAMEAGEFYASEGYCIDFKRDLYADDAFSMADGIKDIASFYNAFGGFIVFGVEEIERDVKYRVVGLGDAKFRMDLVKGKIESWLEHDVPITYKVLTLANGLGVGVLHVPKRPGQDKPNSFRKNGPTTRPGKFPFSEGEVAVRKGDRSVCAKDVSDWQLILSDRNLDSLVATLGRISVGERSGSALQHNLPSRSTICAKFVGRSDVLNALWSWLNDEFQYAKVIAGEGGNGKTSLAYEFATQVAHVAPLGIERIVWLTAKKQQFSGIENSWLRTPETHFESYITMLRAIGSSVGYLDSELESDSELNLRKKVRAEINIQPTLFVLDDIDSLGLDDQRKVLEFAQQSGGDGVRFLLTTRSNASYSSSTAITLRGLSGQDYSDFLSVVKERYGVELPKNGENNLQDATKGSPLLTDSILRVMRRGNSLHKAIGEWKGHSGEDARNAVLGREISQLLPESKRVLLCLALLGQCSKAELMSASGMLEIKLEDALEELRSLFIVEAPKIIESVPRYEIGVNAALLVISKRQELVSDNHAIEKRVREQRSRVRENTQRHNKVVAIAISQALALLKNGEIEKAIATVDAALKSLKGNPDLLLMKARLLSKKEGGDDADTRRLLRNAYDAGSRKHILFDLWYEVERRISFGPGVIEVAGLAMKEFPHEESLWCYRMAEGYVLNGLVRVRNNEFNQGFDELSSAAEQLDFARRKASEMERERLTNFMFGIHDLLISIMPSTTTEFRGDPVSLVREITERGDRRTEVLATLVSTISNRASSLRKSGSDSARDRLRGHRDYAMDLLKNRGATPQSLLRQLQEVDLE